MELGQERSCSVSMELENGTLACQQGSQTCTEDGWGPCVGEDTPNVTLSLGGRRHTAMSAATVTTGCAGNTCDPSCRKFESEGGPFKPTATATSPMPTSSIPDWSGTIGPWKREPCQSGADCQINHRCEGVTTDAACDHDKCTAGGALDSACDPCVARICALAPECCTDDGDPGTEDWSSACAAMVKTECDATCASGGSSGVCHDVCDVGDAMDENCDTCSQQVCGTPGFESCCDAAGEWDAACVTLAKRVCNIPASPVFGAGTHRCDYALMGAGALALYGATVLGGDIGGGTGANAIMPDGFVRSEISNNVYCQGAMDLWQSTVLGNMIAGGSFDPGRCSNLVTGTCVAHSSSVPSASVPTRSLSCGGSVVNVATSQVLAPGSYGAVNVAASGTLTLEPGAYSLSSLTLGANAILEMPASGTVYLDICGALQFGAGVTFSGVTGPSDALRLIIYSGGNVTLGSSAVVYAMITAPTAAALLNPGASASAKTTLHGILHVSTAQLMRHTLLNSTGLTGQACVDAVLDVPSGCPTPGSLPPPSTGTGECVENTLGYVDTTCAGPDLALGFGCGNDVIVCNHGSSDADAGSVVAFYDLSGAQMSTETPDAAFEQGTCTVSVPVKSGECVVQTCPAALTAHDATLMINQAGTTTPAECSQLDNWSLHDSSLSCPGAPLPMIETQRYEATCPEDKKPLWGLLTYTATTPGGADVVFRARVAEQEAELDSATFVPVGLASAALGTESCQLGGPAPDCPADLTLLLGLSTMSQPPFLELEVALNPVGADAPEVADWDVTYSCVVDQ